MQRLQQIDFDYYARWYLRRESREKGRLPAPNVAFVRSLWMKVWHGGKMMPWFETQAKWWLCRLTSVEEMESLLVLPSDWTRGAGIVREDEPRLLGNAARRAQMVYFTRQPDGEPAEVGRRAARGRRFRFGRCYPDHAPLARPRMRAYYERHQNGLRIDGEHAIVLRSLEDDEVREMERWNCRDAKYYLHDGLGRMLSYMALLQRGLVPFQPVAAIVAERVG